MHRWTLFRYASTASLSPASRYVALLEAGTLRPDAAQARAVAALTLVHTSLTRASQPGLVRGLYLHGGPGRGKTALATLLVHPLVAHTHAHDFYRDVHARIAVARGDVDAVASNLAAGIRVLALDELEVTDIADALVLARILTALRLRGVALLATSNRAPEALYAGGLNVELVQPAFGRSIRGACDVLCLDGDETSADYRRVPVATHPRVHGPLASPTASTPLITSARHVDAIWSALCHTYNAPITARHVGVPSAGRTIHAPLTCARALRFSFAALCGANMSATCFSALAAEFDVFMLDDIPTLAGAGEDALRRLVLLVDVLYARRAVIILAAAEHAQWNDVDTLFANIVCGDVSGGLPPPAAAVRVIDKGGSSGRLTTMVTPTMEWSATGRMGASLAALAGGRFAAFSAARCASRLVEMTRLDWVSSGSVLTRSGIDAITGALQRSA